MKKIISLVVSLCILSTAAFATIYTSYQPPFIVDSESERDNTWPDKSFVFCKDTGHLYSLEGGTFTQMYMSATQNSATRPIDGTSFQVSTVSSAFVIYSVDILTTLSLTGGQKGTAYLEISPNNSTWQTIIPYTNGNIGSLTIGLNTSQTQTAILLGYVPVGYYVRIRKVNVTGTPTFTYNSGQEILM